MPDIALDFSHQHPDVNELVANGVKAILFYSRVSTPPRHYIESVVAAGIGALPIFETDATRSFLGFNAGRDDAAAAEGDLRRIGVPEGVRLYVNMADTPNVKGNEDLIRDYANGFAQSFPAKWRLALTDHSMHCAPRSADPSVSMRSGASRRGTHAAPGTRRTTSISGRRNRTSCWCRWRMSHPRSGARMRTGS